MAKTTTITITTMQSGQMRAYADHLFHAIIDFVGPEMPTEGRVKDLAKILVHGFSEPPQPMGPELKLIQRIDNGPGHAKWEVLITRPYSG